ncbi:MAG: hypothetical protein HQK59_15480, partial [Deltaproteobacteria bacterium]|nr:hypothetical protein [Deltaproteobacteria bacterium]
MKEFLKRLDNLTIWIKIVVPIVVVTLGGMIISLAILFSSFRGIVKATDMDKLLPAIMLTAAANGVVLI